MAAVAERLVLGIYVNGINSTPGYVDDTVATLRRIITTQDGFPAGYAIEPCYNGSLDPARVRELATHAFARMVVDQNEFFNMAARFTVTGHVNNQTDPVLDNLYQIVQTAKQDVRDRLSARINNALTREGYARVAIFAHSQGADIVRSVYMDLVNLDPDIRNRISIVSCGGMALIPFFEGEENPNLVFNNICNGDPIIGSQVWTNNIRGYLRENRNFSGREATAHNVGGGGHGIEGYLRCIEVRNRIRHAMRLDVDFTPVGAPPLPQGFQIPQQTYPIDDDVLDREYLAGVGQNRCDCHIL